ncbi:MAG: hypothetical protein ACO3FE_18120 [Planctomycetaceae bacterium]
MQSYPGDPGEQPELSIEYQRWLREYQTREYPRFQFRNLLRDDALQNSGTERASEAGGGATPRALSP